MKKMSAQSAEHWTDEQFIGHLYGVGPADGHLHQCEQCRSRLSMMEARRAQLSIEEPVSDAFLAAQRRSIYARMSEPQRWWQFVPLRRWAAAAAMVCAIAGSATLYRIHVTELAESRDDAKLAAEVSQLSFDSEPQATDPLKGLFIE